MFLHGLPAQATMAEICPLVGLEDDLPIAQGRDGQNLSSQLEAAFQHWCETSHWRCVDEFDDLGEEVTYEPVPPKRLRTVRVRYRPIGRGEALPYDLSE